MSVTLPSVGDPNPIRQNTSIRQIGEQIATLAPLVSPALTGDPTAPTPAGGDNDTSIATTAFVQGELAAYAPLDSPALTGDPTAPTPTAGDNDTSIATTAFVQGEIDGHETTFHADIADQRIVSNISGATGQPSANTLTAILDDIIGTTQGAVLYRNATDWTKLDPGTDGQFLKTQGAAANPAWDDVPVSPWTTLIRTTDDSIASNSTLADDDTLQFSMAANTTYAIRFTLYFTSVNGGVKVGITGPASPTLVLADTRDTVIISSLNRFVQSAFPVTAYGQMCSSTVANIGGPLTFEVLVQNGANAGTFAVQKAQGGGSANATVFRAGSYLKYMVAA